MLHIIAQYRQLFTSFVLNSIVSESGNSDFNADDFNKIPENIRNEYLKNNIKALDLVNYIDSLNSDKNGKENEKLSFYNNGRGDFFGLKDEIALKSILTSVGLNGYSLEKGVNIQDIKDKILSFYGDRQEVLAISKKETGDIKNETIATKKEIKENMEEQFLDNISKSQVKPEKGELYGYEEDGNFILELNDYKFIGSDPFYSFDHTPSIQEIENTVERFNNGKGLDAWGNVPDDKKNNGKLKTKTTKEILEVPTHKILGVETNIDKNEYRNNKELLNLLRNKNVEQLKSIFIQLHSALEKAGVVDPNTGIPNLIDTGIYRNFTIINEDDVNTVLEDAGYNTTRLSGKELGIIYETISNAIETQDKISKNINGEKLDKSDSSKMTDHEIVSLLFDQNGDGLIDTKVRSDFSEAQSSFVTLQSLLTDGIDTFAKNVGYKDKENLLQNMSQNLFSTRENVQRELHSNIQRNGTLEGMVIKGQRVHETNRIIEENDSLEEKKKYVLKGFITEKFGVTKFEELTKSQRTLAEKFIDTITPQSIGLGVADNKFGGGISWDMQEATSLEGIPGLEKIGNFIDAISLGVSEKGAGFAISRGLFKDFLSQYDVSVTLSLINLIMGSLTASVGINEAALDEVEKLFQEETNTKVKFSLVGGITTGLIYTGGLQADFVNENTPLGKEKMTNQLSENLKVALGDIINNKEDSESIISLKDKQAYDILRNVFNASTEGFNTDQKIAFAPKFLDGYVSNFKNKLNENSTGLNITSVGIGVLMVPGFMPIPYVTAGGDLSWQEYKVLKGVSSYKESVDISRIFGKVEKYKDFTVLSFPENLIDTISVEKGLGVQMETNNGKIYISGVEQNDILVKQNITNDDVKNSIIIGTGVINESGDYIDTGLINNPITKSLEIGKQQDINQELFVDIQSDLKNTESIRLDLNKIISYDALNDSNTIGMMKLQRMIFNNRTKGTETLADVWNQYLTVIKYKGFSKYAKTDVNNLITNSENINNDSEKLLILQTVSNNLMEKGGLKQQNDTNYKIDKGQTISQYNQTRNRNTFFDKLMTQELPDISGKITQARNEWYKLNGDLKTYNSLAITDSLGFSGTESKFKSGKINIRGLTPYMGAYNVAGNSIDTAFVKIEGKSEDLINNIPENVLELYKNTLNANGANLNNTYDVKSFINKGGNDYIKIDYTMLFSKNAECLNDCISLKFKLTVAGKEIPLSILGEQESTRNATINKSINLGIAATPKFDKKDKPQDKPKDKPKEEPKEEPKEKPDTTPGNGPGKPPKEPTTPDTTPGNGPGKPPKEPTIPETTPGNGPGKEVAPTNPTTSPSHNGLDTGTTSTGLGTPNSGASGGR